MARIRSPNYPGLGLPEAIEKAKTIHDRERHLAAPKDVIARHLGYSGLNGAALKIVSALLKYGLIEESAEGKMKVSPLAMSILYPKDVDDRKRAIIDAASKPPLFIEIASEWPDGEPSDDNLRSYLVRRKFSSDAIDRVIQSYRETRELVAKEGALYSVDSMVGATLRGLDDPGAGRGTATGQKLPVPPIPARGAQMNVTLNGDAIQVSAVLTDAEAVDKLIRVLQANKPLLPEKPEPKPEEKRVMPEVEGKTDL